MKEHKFHTNIKCSNCEAKVSKILSSEPGIISFDVDLESKSRTLKVKAIDAIREEDIVSMIKVAGFEAKPVKGFFDYFKNKNELNVRFLYLINLLNSFIKMK